MLIHEFRIRYKVPCMFSNNYVVHGIVCNIYTISAHVSKLKEIGYEIVGYDERYRPEKERWYPDENWKEFTPIKKEEIA